MYCIVQEQSGSTSPVVIAHGFHYRSDARLALAHWVSRHAPDAAYDAKDASWHLSGQSERSQVFRLHMGPLA